LKYDVHWLQQSVEDLFELAGRDRRQALRILVAVKTFGRDGHGDMKKLEGPSGEWRLRTGNWRVFLLFEGSRAYVTRIDNRRDAY
jgi:mRNA-degrading endonuclease RelE of RelBE toxin-antitoxin system